MYDSTNPYDIPVDATAMVAGYIDGLYKWPLAGWARFKGQIGVRIAVSYLSDDGHCLDVERGDAEPVDAPGWVAMRRRAGIDPSVYCNFSTWAAVRAAFAAQRVA